MFNFLAQRIAAKLCDESVIKDEDRELYAYGFFMLLSKVFFLILTTVFGLIFGRILESVLFYVLFTVIRSYVGGVHAPSEKICTVLTSLSLFLGVLSIKVLTETDPRYAAYAVFAVAAVGILLFSPLDTNEKPLTDKEKNRYRIISYICLFVIILIGAGAVFFGRSSIFYVSLVSLVLECILLVAGKIKFAVEKRSAAKRCIR